MKKFIIKLISSTMLCLSFSNIYAEETDAENSIDSLLENNSLEVSEEVQTVIENENRDIISEVDSYIISTDYNALNDSYTNTYLVAVPEKIFNEYAISPASTGTKTDGLYDDSYSVYAYVSVTYQTASYNGYTGYLVTKVSGNWQIKDYSVSLSNRTVSYGCTGQYLYGTTFITQTGSKYPSSNSFSYSTGFSTYIMKNVQTSAGCYTNVTLKHGSTSWNLSVSVYLPQ